MAPSKNEFSMFWSASVPKFMLVDKSAQYHPNWSLKVPSHATCCATCCTTKCWAQQCYATLPDVTIYRMESRCYAFDAKQWIPSLNVPMIKLMCNLRCGLCYCFRVYSMTALYCTFLNLSVKHELHYLQFNSMANTNAIIL